MTFNTPTPDMDASADSAIAELELSIEQAQEMVRLGDMAAALANNPEFKKIVLDGYFLQEAARLVHLSTDPALREDIRVVVHRDMAGPGAFKRYLSTLVQRGYMARDQIKAAQEEIDTIREEEAEG